MPAVNDKILQADYNSIRDKIVRVLGNGDGNHGWGQQLRIQSTAVSIDSKVTINEWANLRYDVINAYKHIFGSNPTTATVSEGATIRYTSNFTPDTGTLDVPQRQYDVWADSITTNRFTVAAGESAATSVLSSSRTTAWSDYNYCVIQVSWPNANAARYWFNSGGQIRVSSSRSGGAISNQNTSWESLLSAAGTQNFGAANPGSGILPSDGANWYRTTSSFQKYYSAKASSPYNNNEYYLAARCTDQPNNSGGTATQLEILVAFVDPYNDPGITFIPPGPQNATTAEYPPDDVVDGTLTVNVSSQYATGVMVPASQLFTVTQPTITIGTVASIYPN